MIEQSETIEAYLRQSLHLTRGRICSLAVAVDDRPVVVAHAGETLDADLGTGTALGEAWDAIEVRLLEALRVELVQGGIRRKPHVPGIVVGYNCKSFDIPRIYWRCVRYDHPLIGWVPWPAPHLKPWDVGDRVHDIMIHARGPYSGGRSNSIKQSDLCEYLGVASGEQPGLGAQVYGWAVAGEWSTIAKHNAADIEEVRALYRRLPAYRWAGPVAGAPRVFLDIETIPDPTDPRWGQLVEGEAHQAATVSDQATVATVNESLTVESQPETPSKPELLTRIRMLQRGMSLSARGAALDVAGLTLEHVLSKQGADRLLRLEAALEAAAAEVQ